MKHLLVTNDFPPKIGGIQSLLWEWWRRLPPESFAVLTSPHAEAAAFDAAQQCTLDGAVQRHAGGFGRDRLQLQGLEATRQRSRARRRACRWQRTCPTVGRAAGVRCRA